MVKFDLIKQYLCTETSSSATPAKSGGLFDESDNDDLFNETSPGESKGL